MSPRKPVQYSEEKLLEAVADVKNGRLSQYGIPLSMEYHSLL